MSAKYVIKRPTLCMTVGVPWSGKSLLAQELAKELVNAACISKDSLQNPYTDKRTGHEYSMVQGPTFNILVNFSDDQLGLGKIPIIDAPFSINHTRNDEYRDWVPSFRYVAEKHEARLAIVRCVPPGEEELRRRIEEGVKKGEKPQDQWKLDHWAEFMEQEPFYFPIPHDDVYEIVTDGPVKNELKDVFRYLKARRYIHF